MAYQMSFPAAGSGTYQCHCLISWHWQLFRSGILIDGSHNDVCNSGVITSSTTNSTMIILDVFHSSLCRNWDREAPLQCLACSAPFRGNAPRNSFPTRSGVVLIAKVTTQLKCIYSRAFIPNAKFYMEVAHSASNFRIVLKTTPGKAMLRHFDTCAFILCYFCRIQ